MFYGLVYSAQEIKNKITEYSQQHSIEKSSKIIENLTKEIWGTDTSFFLISWFRQWRIESALSSLLQERETKISVLPILRDSLLECREKKYTSQQINDLLPFEETFKIFSTAELKLLSTWNFTHNNSQPTAANWELWKQEVANSKITK